MIFLNDNKVCKVCITNQIQMKKDKLKVEVKEGYKMCTQCAFQHPKDQFTDKNNKETTRCLRCRNREGIWDKTYRKKDDQRVLSSRIRSDNWRRVKNKSASTKESLGCEWSDLTKWLTYQSNIRYGVDKPNKPHLDHFIPLSSIKKKDEKQTRICCHWTNLQYLTEEDNLRKGDKIASDEEKAERKEIIESYSRSIYTHVK